MSRGKIIKVGFGQRILLVAVSGVVVAGSILLSSSALASELIFELANINNKMDQPRFSMIDSRQQNVEWLSEGLIANGESAGTNNNVIPSNPSGSNTMNQSSLPLIPAPQSWQPGTGSFQKRNFEQKSLVQHLVPKGLLPSAAAEIIEPGLVDESYRLVISADGLELSATSRTGLFRGTQTVRQLMDAAGETIPCGVIEDWPGFRWRGMLLDCGRHYMPMDVIRETIDQLAYHKFNVLHWHLTEDQGWRLEVPGYPRLTEVGSWRQKPDGSQYGGYYTSEQVRAIVAYAAERFITVVPEIELPGHSVAALAAYPEFSCKGQPLEVETQWGIFKDVYCAGNDSTFLFLEDVLTRTMDLFPSRYIHIGGDECPKDRWQSCRKCQQRMVDENLSDEHELQSWFIRRIEKFLVNKKRRLIGWDEILEGGLAPSATVQSWRGLDGAVMAAKQGHDAIVSPTSHCYFDADVGKLDLRQVYTFNPRPEMLSAAESEHILGGEMNLWSEYIPPDRLQKMLFPRMTAMAECLWTDVEHRDYLEFLARLNPHMEVLKAAGISSGPIDRPVEVESVFNEATGATVLQVSLDPELVAALSGHDLQLRQRIISRTEVPGFGPHMLVEDMNLPPVQISDPQVPENLRIEVLGSDIHSSLVAIQLFLDGNSYGTPATVETCEHLALGCQPNFTSPASSRYSGGGSLGLVNGLHGTLDFHDGFWSGYEGVDLNATLDLGGPKRINHLSIRFYQKATVWIFMPQTVEFQVSDDGLNWLSMGKIVHKIPLSSQDTIIHDFVLEDLALHARYVRVIGKTLGICPDWHPGSGRPCWLFADEIVVH